jgi:hypothetical protein
VSVVNGNMGSANASQRAISTDTSAEDVGEQPSPGTVHRTYRPQECGRGVYFCVLGRIGADIAQSRKRYEADVKRIQEAREGLPAVETILGLDEMQVSFS